MLADSHLHFFSPGFVETLPETCRRITPDEVTLYDGLRKAWNIQAVLAVGYEGIPTYAGNNGYLASLARQYDWVKPVAFCKPAELTVNRLKTLHLQRFTGICFYLFGDDAQTLPQVSSDVWQWLEEHRALISVNTKGETWRQWLPILERHPQLRVLVSHMGLPGRWAQTPTAAQVDASLASVLPLAAYPQVHVKFSAFYAISEPMHDYPHGQALPILDKLADAFGLRRLLWGSDYSPCLEFVSFPQTITPLERWGRLADEADRTAVMGGTLLNLLAESRMGTEA